MDIYGTPELYVEISCAKFCQYQSRGMASRVELYSYSKTNLMH